MCKKPKMIRDFEPLLKSNGYHLSRINGSHFIYSNGDATIAVNKDLSKGILRKIGE